MTYISNETNSDMIGCFYVLYVVILNVCHQVGFPRNQTKRFTACKPEEPVYIFPDKVWQ